MLTNIARRRMLFGSVKNMFSAYHRAQFMGFRRFSTINTDVFASRFLTSNMFCMIRNPLYRSPYISISSHMKIPLIEGTTIEDLSNSVSMNHGVSSLKFYTYDGAKIAMSTKVDQLSTLQYFKWVDIWLIQI
jgi:hypothetical protein